MKVNGLLLGQALLFGIIIVFGGIIIAREKIPYLDSKSEKKKINVYFQDNFNNLEVNKGEFKYNRNNNSYSITYYDKNYEKLNFTITSKNNRISDNYKENFVKGKEVIEYSSSLVLTKYNEVFKDTNYKNIEIFFNDLNEYNDAEKIDILENNIYNTLYYGISCDVKVDNLDTIYLNYLINNFIYIAKNNNLIANSYSFTFNNNGIIKIANVLEGGEIIYE